MEYLISNLQYDVINDTKTMKITISDKCCLHFIISTTIYDFPRVNSREIRIEFYKRKIHFAPPLGHNGTPPWGKMELRVRIAPSEL